MPVQGVIEKTAKTGYFALRKTREIQQRMGKVAESHMEIKRVAKKKKLNLLLQISKVSQLRTLLSSFFEVCANHVFHSNLNYLHAVPIKLILY